MVMATACLMQAREMFDFIRTKIKFDSPNCGGIFIYLGTARRGARPAHGCVAGWGYREIVWREKEGAFLECAG